MQEVRFGLEAFLRGETDIDGLLASIDQALQQDEAGVPEFLSELRGLYHSGQLPPQLLSVVEQRVAAASRRRTDFPPSSEPRSPGVNGEEPPDVLRSASASEKPPPVGEQRPSPEAGNVDALGRVSNAEAGMVELGVRAGAPSADHAPASWSRSRVSGYSSDRFLGPQPGEPNVGQVLKERFELVEVLGRGGMSVVFKAKDRRKAEALDRNPYVALKLLNEDYKRHPEALKTLQREARKAQGLKHRNVISIYDFDKDENDNYFVAMELLTGSTLDRLIRKNRVTGGMDPREAYLLIEQMGQALQAAHNQDPPIVHSDFKPGNVFLTEGGEIKVFDFGIARAARSAAVEPGDITQFDAGVLGALTPAYASPEMLAGMEPDPRDDIYGLAVVAYELLSGYRPFGRVKTAVDAVASGLRPERLGTLSSRQWKGLERALAFERERRTRSVEQFLDDLRFRRSFVPVYVAAGVAVTLVASWFLIGEPLLKAQREEAIARDVATVDQSRLPDMIESVSELSEAAQARVHEQIAERLLRPLVKGDAGEAAAAVGMVRNFPRPIQEAVYRGMEEPLVARLLDADPDVAAAASSLLEKLPPAVGEAVFASAGTRLVAGFMDADAAGVAALLETTESLPQEFRRQVYSRARSPIIESFKASARHSFAPDAGRYDYTGARDLLEQALALYRDSKAVEDERARMQASYGQVVSDLETTLARALDTGRLLPGETDISVPKILDRLTHLNPDIYPDAHRDLAQVYLGHAEDARSRGDVADALAYVDTGLRLFPEDASLTDAQANLVAIRARFLDQTKLAAARDALRRLLQDRAVLNDHEVLAEEIKKLQSLRPDDPLVSEGKGRLGELLDAKLSEFSAAHAWNAGANLIDGYSDLLRQEVLSEKRQRLNAAQNDFERQVAGLMWRISEAAQAGRADDAHAILGKLMALSPEKGTVAQARGKVAQAYLALAREARAAGRWDEARTMAKEGLERIPDARVADSFDAELAEIDRAEIDRAENERRGGPDATGDERLHEKRLHEIAAIRKDFETRLGTMEAEQGDALEALAVLDWLAAVNPTDSLISTGRERIAARFVERAEVLAADGHWEDAVAAIGQGRSVVPESSALAQALARIESRRFEDLETHEAKASVSPQVSRDAVSREKETATHGVERKPALEYWTLVKDTGNVAAVQAFLDSFQDPVLKALAEQRLQELKAAERIAGRQEPLTSAEESAEVPFGATDQSSDSAGSDGGEGEALRALKRAAEIPPHLIQQALKDLGYHNGAVDGKIGPGTREGIRAFQKARGLAQTGDLTHEQRVALIRTAAEAGRAESQNTLGMMAAEGVGIPKNLETAFHWFRTAADQGNRHAAYNLGILFRDGRGVARSESQARRYFELALADGHPRARRAIEALDD